MALSLNACHCGAYHVTVFSIISLEMFLFCFWCLSSMQHINMHIVYKYLLSISTSSSSLCFLFQEMTTKHQCGDFICALDCGLNGYKNGTNGCHVCACAMWSHKHPRSGIWKNVHKLKKYLRNMRYSYMYHVECKKTTFNSHRAEASPACTISDVCISDTYMDMRSREKMDLCI